MPTINVGGNRFADLVNLVDRRIDYLRSELGEHDQDLERAEELIAEARKLIARSTNGVLATARSFGTVGAAVDGLKDIRRGMP